MSSSTACDWRWSLALGRGIGRICWGGLGQPAAVLAAGRAELQEVRRHRAEDCGADRGGADRRSTSRRNWHWRPRTGSMCWWKAMTAIRGCLRQIHDPPGVLFRRGTASATGRAGDCDCRHAACHALWTGTSGAAGRELGSDWLHGGERAGARDRCGRPSRRAGGGRADDRGAWQRTLEYLSAGARAVGATKLRPAATC